MCFVPFHIFQYLFVNIQRNIHHGHECAVIHFNADKFSYKIFNHFCFKQYSVTSANTGKHKYLCVEKVEQNFMIYCMPFAWVSNVCMDGYI